MDLPWFRSDAEVPERLPSPAAAVARYVLVASLSGALLVGGCGDAPSDGVGQALPEGVFALVSGTDWRRLTPERSPRALSQESSVPCAQPLPHIEEGLVEFDTKLCAAFAVESPLLASMRAGDRIEVLLSHSVLLSETPGRGRFEVWIDEDRLLVYDASIPGPSALRRYTLRAPRSFGDESWVRVFVENHGANAWRLHLLQVERP
mgnify:CR=1 FL=1